jgi:uncharacterized membrane protein
MRGGFPAGNPIANVLVVIAGAVILTASLVLGFFAFLALSAIVLVVAAVVGLRVWWLNRRLARGERRSRRAPADRNGVIEGEYRVVKKDRDEA